MQLHLYLLIYLLVQLYPKALKDKQGQLTLLQYDLPKSKSSLASEGNLPPPIKSKFF